LPVACACGCAHAVANDRDYVSAGAAAAILPVSAPLRIHIDHYEEGIPRLGVAAADTSYVIVRASFSADSPLKTEVFGVSKGIDFGAPPVKFTLKFVQNS
jgi:hypothetical protein